MRIPYSVHLAVLGTVLAVGAFQLGQARANGQRLERRRTAVVDAVAHAGPAVVSVDAYRAGRRSLTRMSGAGVIVHPDGYVVTNSHVVSGGERFSVELFGGQGTLPATLVVDHPAGDLAILKITRPGAFRHVSLCRTSDLMLGETAIAIGNPHGLGDTITVGAVSALGRTAKMQTGTALANLIQTDASINTGNSGGALLNLDGELIGINVSLLPSATGIAFAIPADSVEVLLQRAVGRRVPPNALPPGWDDREPVAAAPPPRPAPAPTPTPRTPVSVPPARPRAPAPQALTPLRPLDLGFDLQDTGAVVRVNRVDRSSAADISGLTVGDVLLTIDGRPVEGLADLLLAFSASRPGREYYLTMRRGGLVTDAVLVTPR